MNKQPDPSLENDVLWRMLNSPPSPHPQPKPKKRAKKRAKKPPK